MVRKIKFFLVIIVLNVENCYFCFKNLNPELDVTFSELKQAFDICANEDGVINLTDLRNVMKSVGQNPSTFDLEIMIKEADANNDGMIDFPEFVAVLMRFLGKKEDCNFEEEFAAIFDEKDKLSAKKLKDEMERLGVKLNENELEDLIRESDLNGDGTVSKKGRLINIFIIRFIKKIDKIIYFYRIRTYGSS